MRQFTHPTLSLPSPSKLCASASVKQTTAVCTPPKRLYSLHCSPRSGLPSAIQSAATTSSPVMVSLRYLTSTDLFETKDLTSALCPTACPSAFSKAETSPPYFRTKRHLFFLLRFLRRGRRNLSLLLFIFLLFFLRFFHQLPFPILLWGLASHILIFFYKLPPPPDKKN